MADLPDFPSWVAEAEKWEAAIRKDQTAKCAAIVRGMKRHDPMTEIWDTRMEEIATEMEAGDG